MDRLDLRLWDQALSHIQRELPSQAYETWFQPTRAVASTADSLVIEVPNPFFRDWLSSHYTDLIDGALEEIARLKVGVEYVVASQEKPVAAVAEPVLSAAATASESSRAASASRATHAGGSFAGIGVDRTGSSEFLLNPRYTFEQFVVGPSNRFAHAASLAVCGSPARVYNPLFIHGGVGLGKTHLMQAVGHRYRESFPHAKCIYVSSERFTNQLISAIQNRSMSSFRDRFRSVDILLVDDIHFIGGKESTQEVFFHTFNALYDAHKQIVISSDRPPKELRGVEERLVSRFEWGLVTDVQAPDLETRVAILRKKAETQGQQVPDDVTLFIAERISSNIRELEGALNRVIAYAVLTSREISLGMAQETLKGMVAETSKRVTLEKIQQLVALRFNLSVSELKGKRRTKEVSFARQVAMALTRELTEASLPAIGAAFGGRDHATVIYACSKILEARKEGGKTKLLVDSLVAELKQGL